MEFKFIEITIRYKYAIRTVINVYPDFWAPCGLIPCSFHDFQHFILVLFCFDGWYRGVHWLTWIAYSNLPLGYLIVIERTKSVIIPIQSFNNLNMLDRKIPLFFAPFSRAGCSNRKWCYAPWCRWRDDQLRCRF